MAGNRCIAVDARMIESSGIGTYLRILLENNVYDIAVGDPEVIHRYNPDIPVIEFKAGIYGLQEQLKYPVKELKQAGVTLMHFPHYNVPFLFPLPYVVTIHDLIHIVFPEFMKNRIAAVYARLLMKHTADHAAKILTDAEYTKKDLIKRLHVGQDRIRVIPLTVDPVFRVIENIDESAVREKFHIPEHKKLLLYVGNIRPHKNVALFLKAFSKSSHQDDAVIVLAGKSTIDEEMKALEEELNLSQKVIHTGLISEADLINLYNIAYGFVFPSLYEGFGLPPLEAMACGTPVICSNSSTLPEVAEGAALLFDPHKQAELTECIDRLLSDESLHQELIQKGFEQVKKFPKEEFIQKTKDALEGIQKESDHQI